MATLLCAAALLCACAPKEASPQKREAVSFAQGGFTALLPELAKENGYFAEEGIDAKLTPYGDGKSALDAFLNGEDTFALVGEPPVANAAFARDDFVILATLMTSDNATRILVNKASGIHTPSDLKGKRIATVKGVAAHFFLDLYLRKNKIKPGETTVVFLDAKELAHTLVEGKIDAYAMTDRYLLQGIKLLGDKALVLSEKGLCLNGVYLVAKRDFVADNPGVAKRALLALLKAEKALAASPEEAVRFFARTRNIPEAEAKAHLADQSHALTLTQPAVLALDDTAKWALETGMATGGPPPNFLNRIAPEPLREVKPHAVRLIR